MSLLDAILTFIGAVGLFGAWIGVEILLAQLPQRPRGIVWAGLSLSTLAALFYGGLMVFGVNEAGAYALAYILLVMGLVFYVAGMLGLRGQDEQKTAAHPVLVNTRRE